MYKYGLLIGVHLDVERVNELWRGMELGTKMSPKDLIQFLSVNLTEHEADMFNEGENVKRLNNFVLTFQKTGKIQKELEGTPEYGPIWD